MALARGGFAVLLLALLMVIEGADDQVCTYKYAVVPSTEAAERCNIAGSSVILNCQVTGQVNANLSIYWYKTTNATLIGRQTLMPVTIEDLGYEVMERLNPDTMGLSSVRSTLTIGIVQESDFAYFWCWAALDGTHLPNPSSVVLLSPPCDSNMRQCTDGTPLFTPLSDILCAAGTTQPVQTPQPPLCTSQPTRLLSPTTTSTATDSPLPTLLLSPTTTSTATDSPLPPSSLSSFSISLTSAAITDLGNTSLNPNSPTTSIDPTPTLNLAAPPQLGSQPQAWVYAVAVVGVLLCGIILILVLIVAVQYRLRKKGSAIPPPSASNPSYMIPDMQGYTIERKQDLEQIMAKSSYEEEPAYAEISARIPETPIYDQPLPNPNSHSNSQHSTHSLPPPLLLTPIPDMAQEYLVPSPTPNAIRQDVFSIQFQEALESESESGSQSSLNGSFIAEKTALSSNVGQASGRVDIYNLSLSGKDDDEYHHLEDAKVGDYDKAAAPPRTATQAVGDKFIRDEIRHPSSPGNYEPDTVGPSPDSSACSGSQAVIGAAQSPRSPITVAYESSPEHNKQESPLYHTLEPPVNLGQRSTLGDGRPRHTKVRIVTSSPTLSLPMPSAGSNTAASQAVISAQSPRTPIIIAYASSPEMNEEESDGPLYHTLEPPANLGKRSTLSDNGTRHTNLQAETSLPQHKYTPIDTTQQTTESEYIKPILFSPDHYMSEKGHLYHVLETAPTKPSSWL